MDGPEIKRTSLELFSPEIEPKISPTPIEPKATCTDSMVSINLSGIESTSEPETDAKTHNPATLSGSTFDQILIQAQASPLPSPFPNIDDELLAEDVPEVPRRRSESTGSGCSTDVTQLDWEELDRNEEQEQRDEASDESVAFLLARLEQENNALAIDPKAGKPEPSRKRTKSRPPSIHQLKKLVNEPARASLRYSMLPSPPPMTELEFWAALVTNYSQTAHRLPTLTSNKIRGGIPPPLRGVVWMSIAGSRDSLLEDEFDRLRGESSPYENLIGKDMGRTFPGIDMFRDPNGDGQKMLGRVLKCFSLWDQKIGYCQGLGFVVGPLLMHMGDKEAFCVLVRLMEHYDLRSCFLPDLSGLHLRIHQFQNLLRQHLPELSAHLDKMQVEPLYLSQWFLSFFGVTCPLPMLLRIYDVILTEGASETLMRVALSLMRRNEQKILSCTEFEDIMSLLLSRSLWDTYGCNADELVNDFVGLTGLVTRESLQALELSFKEAHVEGAVPKGGSMQAATSRFLGRFWAGSQTITTKSALQSPGLAAPSRPVSYLARSPSKQSIASATMSIDGSESSAGTVSTEMSTVSTQSSVDNAISKTSNIPLPRSVNTNTDRDFHSQIEDLLTALSDMQRDQSILATELQREREDREEDRAVVQRAVEKIRKPSTLAAIPEDPTERVNASGEPPVWSADAGDAFVELEDRFAIAVNKRLSLHQTKHQLREDANRWKEQYNTEAARSSEMSRRMSEMERENSQIKDQLREARARVQDSHKDRQRLEKSMNDLRSRKSSISEGSFEVKSPTLQNGLDAKGPAAGLRELRLGRSGTAPVDSQPAFSKRTSSLSTQMLLATEDLKPAAEDALLLELVQAKTAEAVAKEELEEVKGKLEALRKMLGGSPISPGSSAHRSSPSEPIFKSTDKVTPKLSTPNTPQSGGFFSGWGKRSVSAAVPSTVSAES